MLYEPDRHEELTGTPWDETRTRAAIDRIVTDAHRVFDPQTLWPLHPFDRSPERPPDSLKPIYHGAAGVIWALTYLKETGAIRLERDYLPTVRELVNRNRDDLLKHRDVRE